MNRDEFQAILVQLLGDKISGQEAVFLFDKLQEWRPRDTLNFEEFSNIFLSLQATGGLHSGTHESETCFPSEQKSSSSTWSVAGAALAVHEPEDDQSAASSADFLKDTKRDT